MENFALSEIVWLLGRALTSKPARRATSVVQTLDALTLGSCLYSPKSLLAMCQQTEKEEHTGDIAVPVYWSRSS